MNGPVYLSTVANEVLSRYPAPLRGGSIQTLGNSGGFSGASIFRVVNPGGIFCLRRGPADCQAENLTWIHHHLNAARDAGLTFVPGVFSASDGCTVVRHDGRLWELQEWMPGCSDFHAQPSAARLQNACVALAQLHSEWGQVVAAVLPCPAVGRRLQSLRRWHALAPTAMPASTLVARARAVLSPWLPRLVPWLQPWVNLPLPLHPCLCDVWHDHVLFTQDRVTGIIDYGATKVDHAAVDVARMLGSLVGDDEVAWKTGLIAYRSVRALSDEEERLAHVLDVTGTVLGVANWLMRVAVEQRTEEDQRAVARRLETLVRRIEGWETKPPLAAER